MTEPALLVFLAVVAVAVALWWISPGEHKMPPPSMTAPAPQPFHTGQSVQSFQTGQAAPPFHHEQESNRFTHTHVPPEVIEAVERGDLIEAVKRMRETGMGLKEAKAALEEFSRRRTSHDFAPPPPLPKAAGQVPPGVIDALERGETILAIKIYRKATGVGLADAKAFVDGLRRRRKG